MSIVSIRASLLAQTVKDPPTIQKTLGPEDSPRHVNPLHYSCLENSMDRGAWQATVHGVTKSWTQLSELYLTHGQHIHILIRG